MNWIELIGYAGTGAVILSMVMSSIVKLRWVNLTGNIFFTLYGILIAAYPIALTNLLIMFINIYFLIKIYGKKEEFRLLSVRTVNRYLIAFLEFYNKDIQRFYPGFSYNPDSTDLSVLVLRNMNVAGVLVAHKKEDALHIDLDYVIPEFRDYKLGKYIYNENIEFFRQTGANKLVACCLSEKHRKYFEKVGFMPQSNDNKLYFKKIE